LYLWKTLEEYAHNEVKLVKTHHHTGDELHIEGMNDTQVEQILEWFGPRSNWQGGKVPVVHNISMALVYWHVELIDRPKTHNGKYY
jgi:hypothetical protein